MEKVQKRQGHAIVLTGQAGTFGCRRTSVPRRKDCASRSSTEENCHDRSQTWTLTTNKIKVSTQRKKLILEEEQHDRQCSRPVLQLSSSYQEPKEEPIKTTHISSKPWETMTADFGAWAIYIWTDTST